MAEKNPPQIIQPHPQHRRHQEIIAGLCAGFSTTIIMHPLDLIKVRLQVSRETPSGPFGLLRKVVKDVNQSASIQFQANPGIPKSIHILKHFYRGLGVNLVGNVVGWAAYFSLYAEFKLLVHTPLQTVNYFLSSALAGCTSALLTNPVWVLKTRILATNTTDNRAYSSLFDGIRRIWVNEGLLSFWRGTLPGMLLVFQASLQFVFYDHLKVYFLQDRLQPGGGRGTGTGAGIPVPRTQLDTVDYLYSSAISKTASMMIMYPAQVVKLRMQMAILERRSISDVCRDVWTHEGRYKGFYKGLGANMVRLVPATCITFVVYESVRNQI